MIVLLGYLFVVRKTNKSISSFFTERYYETDYSKVDKIQNSYSSADVSVLNE